MSVEIIRSILGSHFVSRWNGCNIIGHRRSISEHSYEVAMFTKLLCEKLKSQNRASIALEALNYALIHDLPEVVTSDVSHIVKKNNPQLKNLLDKISDDWLKEIGLYSDVTPNALLIVKTADTIAVAIEIKEQLKLRNTVGMDMTNVDNIISNALNKYKDLVDPEVYECCKNELLLEQIWNRI